MHAFGYLSRITGSQESVSLAHDDRTGCMCAVTQSCMQNADSLQAVSVVQHCTCYTIQSKFIAKCGYCTAFTLMVIWSHTVHVLFLFCFLSLNCSDEKVGQSWLHFTFKFLNVIFTAHRSELCTLHAVTTFDIYWKLQLVTLSFNQ